MATEMPDKEYRKIVNSWARYDWANSAFVTTIMAAMFPPFYRSLVISAGFGEANATAFWAYTTSLALFLIAILAPVLGAISDHTGGKKRYIGFFAGIVGPLLFGVVSQVAGGSRLSIVSLVIFFIVGGFLLTRVDEQEAMRVAREEDAAFALAGA